MSSIVVCMEPDQVAVEDASQQRLTDRQNPVDLAARKRCVEEEANLDVLLGVANLLAEHLGEQHQVIVVNPDQVAVLHILDNGLGEQPVDFSVRAPRRLVEGDLARVIMEQGPKDGVCHTSINTKRTIATRTGNES
jgi:hypothetical protein